MTISRGQARKAAKYAKKVFEPIRTLRRKIIRERNRVNRAFIAHITKNNCVTDSGGCTIRAMFQERFATLTWILAQIDGNKQDDDISLPWTVNDELK